MTDQKTIPAKMGRLYNYAGLWALLAAIYTLLTLNALRRLDVMELGGWASATLMAIILLWDEVKRQYGVK